MESTRPIRALVRGLEALTVLNQRGDASVSDIARQIRLPRTTVYRILETLCEAGFVVREPDERYHLTVQVRGLSAGFDDEPWITLIARPVLGELAAQLVWPVYLATPAGEQLLVRETTDQYSPFALERLPAGVPLPLLGSAAGRTYLAFCDAAERDARLDALAHSGAEEVGAPQDLQRVLEQIRTKGHALMTRSSRLTDELNLSVPVQLAERTLAVLTARFLSASLPSKIALERILPRLRQCAAKIANQFSVHQAGARHSSAPPTAA